MRALAIVVALRAATAAARAAEINAFISTAIKVVTDELLPPFERIRSDFDHDDFVVIRHPAGKTTS